VDKMNLEDYSYLLQKKNIALYPSKKRENSKLLVYKSKKITDTLFNKIINYIPRGSTIFFNDTKVIKCRFLFNKSQNIIVEILVINFVILSKNSVEINGLIGNNKKWKENENLISIKNSLKLKAVKKNNKIILSWNKIKEWTEIINIFGTLPLPPYIKRDVEESDLKDYQTVYSKKEGSVASPTAGLHFSNEIIEKLKLKNKTDYLTLHVGIGTFKPINEENIVDHNMHSEEIIISKRNISNLKKSKNIVAVGTTSLRTLESLYFLGIKLLNNDVDINIEQYPYIKNYKTYNKNQICNIILSYMNSKNLNSIRFRSSLFILPGYDFKFCNQLITNFHYPKSTLILLIAAFVGKDWKKIYKFASKNKFRFLSYGDSSLLFKK
tara:strand:- start:1381 stop:2523 length:1143 start_codon:yes stop_codon:yes gene_type:complete